MAPLKICVPGQQRFDVFHGRRSTDMLQHMVDVGKGVDIVGLGRFYQAVDGGAGFGTTRGIGKQLSMANNFDPLLANM